MKRKIISLLVALCVILPLPSLFASEVGNIQILFEDITETDTTALLGEAKIKVSVKGAAGNVSIAQIALEFEGNLKYKSIQFLKGENNPPQGVLYSPNAAQTNTTKKLMPSIISNSFLKFEDVTPLFILTFAGNAGEKVTVKANDFDNTYCTVGGVDFKPTQNATVHATASTKQNASKKAIIKLVMDKVTDFVGGSTEDGYNGSGVEVKITSEKIHGNTFYTVLNNTLVSKGGHRENVSMPTFTIENEVLADDTYTVEISGLGYVPYTATGITFNTPIEISNNQFVPGDVNGDGKVDSADIEDANLIISNNEYSEVADFNRDGKVNNYDMAVFSGIENEQAVPPKMPEPTATGGDKKVTITWAKLSDNVVTGYKIKYGTNSENLSDTKEITSADITSTDITGLSANTTYYLQIAGINAGGTGIYSDVVSVKTNTGAGNGSGGNGGGGTGGGGSGGGGAPVSAPASPTDPTTSAPAGEFTDLGNYDWAKDSIYNLKEKGIISGVSATEYAPASNIKRGDFILILTRMLGITGNAEENFIDVPTDSYYYNAISAAKAAGIASGDGKNFMPEASITRQDLITLSYRAFLSKGYINETTDLASIDVFSDKSEISDYATAPLASMVKAGIIQGSDGKVNPKGNATRAEVAVMCARLLELMK
jgi:hypothetical protein